MDVYLFMCLCARVEKGVMVVVVGGGGGGGGGELWFSTLLLRRVNMTNEPRVWHD